MSFPSPLTRPPDFRIGRCDRENGAWENAASASVRPSVLLSLRVVVETDFVGSIVQRGEEGLALDRESQPRSGRVPFFACLFGISERFAQIGTWNRGEREAGKEAASAHGRPVCQSNCSAQREFAFPFLSFVSRLHD